MRFELNIRGSRIFYYFIQPYFFAHAHLYRRKIEALRSRKIEAWGLAFVPYDLKKLHAERYREVEAQGFIKIIDVRSVKNIGRAAALFVLRQLFAGTNIVVQVLRSDPTWLLALRRLPKVSQRLRLILEFEGDQAEELLYQEAFLESDKRLAMPSAAAQSAAKDMVRRQARMLGRFDGMVLMSEEHLGLWRHRLSHLPPAAIVPSLHDPEATGFDAELREVRRRELGWSDRLVLIYTGNVICSWQRFPELCRFVARLREFFPEICLLALVRKDDMALAAMSIEKEGLDEVSRVLSVPSSEVASYLCAADFGLYLRHRHPMNMVVTSAKLGEYLACGLPVITTGANAEILNAFIREANAGIFLSDDLIISEDFVLQMEAFHRESDDFRTREAIVEAFRTLFTGPRDPLNLYRDFVASLLGAPSGEQTSLSDVTSQP